MLHFKDTFDKKYLKLKITLSEMIEYTEMQRFFFHVLEITLVERLV